MKAGHPTDVVLTIAERDYLFGAAALYNSLVASGFEGEFVIFCRGIDGMCPRVLAELQARRQPRVSFRMVETPRHLAMQKAAFISACFKEWPEAACVTYFDPDIVVNEVRWSQMRTWCDAGVALGADVNWAMPSRHPTRRAWINLLAGAGYVARRDFDMYLNAGFVGLAAKNAGFARLWEELIEQFGAINKPLELGGEIKDWPRKGRWETVELPDQDTLNMAAMSWQGGVTTFGPDLMGFAPGSAYLPHALGFIKPWKRNYLKQALDGRAPRLIDKVFWDHANEPVAIASPARIALKKFEVATTAAIGRVYRR